ncbi:origin recognition complex subunit 3 [Blastomyces dermatitidis ER-3]|uniref:Origin recognition complex subunit 3 n=3 Tax=Blastomyces TaxID=229219 RepID=A0A179U9Q8_BLAGS|nr:origin recognition complex subunit 3 [Blastomyces gilchristii SLH14081]XP_045275928.1 origin recognition complex subunit 3 [Blastomyces dermatitidis ER-3]EEQ88891.1 origin recognition complex subunit 3 [Blastomyces dermatitidis ER-3]EGE81698.1 origin recognition complex subunit 3 [Blastomyces dermatitidis ATCC 18188]OAT04453.1 origin recognition complex subunit 3 [Blastomyces gilchristii SLH14081]
MTSVDYHHENRGLESLNGLEHQSTYVYKPVQKNTSQNERPSKRRKVSSALAHEKQNDLLFAPLLEGNEDMESVKLRYSLFQEFWETQEQQIQGILRDVDSEILDHVSTFVEQTSHDNGNGRIPAGLITLGSNFSSIGRLLDRLHRQMQSTAIGQVVALDSGDASNLKTVLKYIIRSGTSVVRDVDGDQDLPTDRAGPKPLAYDLDILHDHVKQKGIRKVVIVFRDSEAFDHGLLADLISLFSSWVDRIPFVLLFGIATSVELFEARLPRSLVNLLQGCRFDIQDSGDSVNRIYTTLQMCQEGTLWLGHNVSRILFERSKDHFQSPEGFANGIKYVYMAHFFANPLCTLLSKIESANILQSDLCQAIRNLPSFRRHVYGLLDEGEAGKARTLLEDDELLARYARANIRSGQEKINAMLHSVETLSTVLRILKIPRTPTLSELTIQALAGELLGSKIVEDMLAGLKKLPSNTIETILGALPQGMVEFDASRDVQGTLQSLLQNKKGSGPLRSEYDEYHSTHKTTVVGQRVKLTKSKAKLSKQDIEYTAFVNDLSAAFQDYFSINLISPLDLFMHEAFLYDLKTPIKGAFTPRPRSTIERALSTPFDYLATSALSADDEEMMPSKPAISILYNLYSETGSLVNVYDLWRAYYTMAGGDDGEEPDERQTLAVFYRALSELKMMGMVKHSKKKIDHLAKSTWMGL